MGIVLQVPVTAHDAKAGTITYEHPDTKEPVTVPVTGGACKLQWKPDWAMRWVALGIDYEMAGKDLIDSVKLSGAIVRALGGDAPEGFNYELFLDEKGQKISKSKGNGLTIDEWLAYASPESLSLFMYQKPREAKRLYFDVIPRAVDDYLQFLGGYERQDWKNRLGNPVWHIHAGDPPAPLEERYAAAVDLLAALHSVPKPDVLRVDASTMYRVPRYDIGAMLIEVSLLIDWFLPFRDVTPGDALRADYRMLWRDALQPALAAPPTWVLRDNHSPNLIWLPHRDGIKRVGVLDFQDAVMGPAAYDVASLLQDARVDVPEALEIGLLTRYTRARLNEPDFDAKSFTHLYALMAAQRASKILCIFARLDNRDGKPQYLRHLPRVWTYLQRALAHPALAPLSAWYRDNIPAPDTKNP